MQTDRTDDSLVELFKGGDTAAYEELIGRYSEKAYNLAMRITRLQEDAEEILQDVFISVYNKIGEFEGKSAFSSWLYRITVNTAFMKLRKRKKHAAVTLDEVTLGSQQCWIGRRSDACDINYMTSRHELVAALQVAIEKLPPDYKIIFVLRDVDGLSNHEVGEVLGLSIPAVKSRLHRSRLMLRKKLQRFHDDYHNADEIAFGPRAKIQSNTYKQAA